MASPRWRHPANTQVAQIWKGTITTTTNGHTYTVTLTDDNDETAVITYTVAGSPATTTLVAEAFVSAWNASLNPLVAKLTASNVAGQVVLTADTAGRPFALTASGSGTWTGTGVTTASVSNNDYGQATNFSFDAEPTTNDNPIIPPGNVSILYGLNKSAVAIDAFTVQDGFAGNIGLVEQGILKYLRIDPNSLVIRGQSPLLAIDAGAASIDALIAATGAPTGIGLSAVYLKGSGLGTVRILSGNVGLGAWHGDTATIGEVVVGEDSRGARSLVTIGSGVTLTTLSAGSGQTTLNCAATTVTVGKGARLDTFGEGAIATLNAYGQVFPNSEGTITTLNAYGHVDFTKDLADRTVTNLNLFDGSHVIYHAGITFGAINYPTTPAKYTLECR